VAVRFAVFTGYPSLLAAAVRWHRNETRLVQSKRFVHYDVGGDI
jgi:hypothetical protein